jgi:hypothetical protein
MQVSRPPIRAGYSIAYSILVPPAGFERAHKAPEANTVRGNYLVKHAAPAWLGGV